ncbi:MAG: hypothetical protein H7338_09220 [Candidatus Sericytochromatia bacterium]|nr:hypothetical protein [Candidatus Sericytochromatia bacterium]
MPGSANPLAVLGNMALGTIVRMAAWPTLYWEVLEQAGPLLTVVRLVGTDIRSALYARGEVEVVDLPDSVDAEFP